MQLPEKYRKAVEATDLKGASQKAHAEELGLPTSTVKSRVQRGRKMLGNLFHECCSYELDARGNIMVIRPGQIVAKLIKGSLRGQALLNCKFTLADYYHWTFPIRGIKANVEYNSSSNGHGFKFALD